MSIFQRELISGNVFIDEDTSGVFEHRFTDTVDAGWENAHTIENIHLYGQHAGLDFQQRMMQISGIVFATGFANLVHEEKDIVGLYSAATDTELVSHYTSEHTGGDLAAALELHAVNIGNFVTEMDKVAVVRINHTKTKIVIMKYLKDRPQIDLFMSAIRNMISDYKFKFHLGTQYGDSTDGIMDYFENTGGYSGDGVGLDSYEFSDVYKQMWYATNAVDPNNPTQAEQDSAHDYVRDLLKTELVNILLHGITE